MAQRQAFQDATSVIDGSLILSQFRDENSRRRLIPDILPWRRLVGEDFFYGWLQLLPEKTHFPRKSP
ncbi:MAG: hypothetical protein ACE5K7_01360, partial [Phycisphaerae bacterium]